MKRKRICGWLATLAVCVLAVAPVRTYAAAVRGDVDGNGVVDSSDARLVLQYAVGKVDAAAVNLAVADVDGSGTVDSTDARWILQRAVGKIAGFPDQTRQLQITVNGEQVTLSFIQEGEYDGHVYYRYTGVAPSGNSVGCEVVPLANAVHSVTYVPPQEEEFTHGLPEVYAFLKTAFEEMGMTLPGKTDIMMYTEGPFRGQNYVNVSAWFKYDYGNHSEYVSVVVKETGGELYIAEMNAYGLDGGKQTTPYLVEKQQTYFVPDWV